MDFVTPIITPIVESLLVPVKRHLDFLVSSSDYARGMHAKARELNRAARVLDTKRKANNINTLEVPDNLSEWLEEVEKIKVREDSIPTTGVGCFNIKMRYKVGKQSYDIQKDIDILMKEKSEMVWTDEIIPIAMVSTRRPTASTTILDDNQNQNQNQNKNRIKSRDLIFNAALKSLETNDGNQKMALCGMGGVGKTTMMEQLKEAAKDRKMFDSIVKVSIGQTPNLFNVQNVVAEYTGRALTEKTKDVRAERLEKRFQEMSEEGKRKILVILDDVWEEFNLKDIGLKSPLPPGIKLLITSREETVCTQMGVEANSIFRVVVLKESEAKSLFWEIAGLVSDSDIELDLHHIGEEIIKGCGGLPIAIKTIASTLRDNKEKCAWEDAVLRLQNKEFNVHNIFDISYRNLKEDYDKATFLLSGLFLEDNDINIEDLLMYGWGLKIFKNVHTIAQARSRVNTCINKLIHSNLLIKSDYEGFVKMHDLVRDFVLSSFSEVKQASVMCDDDYGFEKLIEDKSYERIMLDCRGILEFPIDFNHPNLKLLKLMFGDKQLQFPEDFYARMEKLEVLVYEHVYRPLLPQYSTYLRALSLSSCSLMNDDISFLGDLINLEVLCLADCGIHKLPSKIGSLKKLKLLDLNGCFDLCIEDDVFRNLNKLEELYMGVSEGSAIGFTDAVREEFKKLSKKLFALELEFSKNNVQPTYVSFEKLERFRISMGCLFENSMSTWGYIDRYPFKNTLILETSSKELLECKVNELFKSTEILYLKVNDMYYLEDILVHPPQSSFCNLKTLNIFNCADLTYLFTIPIAKGLMKLERLQISSCAVLKSVVHGENEVIKFDKLKFLSLKDLPELVCLCDPPTNVIGLPQLLELRLEKLPHVTGIFADNNDSKASSKQSLFNKEVPKLENLSISSMDHLTEIWPSKEVVDRSMLKEIKIESCKSLLNLFPCNPMRLLRYLEELIVKSCDSIEALFNIDLGKTEQFSDGNDTLRKIEVESCDSFREVWRIKDVDENYSRLLISGFQGVEKIDIKSCKKFINIFTPANAIFDLRALKYIDINECGEYSETKDQSINTTEEQENVILAKQEISEVGALMPIVALPSYDPIKFNFHELRKIKLDKVQGMEVLFEIESPSNRYQQPLLFLPYLEGVALCNMDNMTHVWKCSNWNEFFILQKQQPQSSSFQSLTTILLFKCKSIKFLFSPHMVKLLSNLKRVGIFHCDSMKQVVSYTNDETATLTSSHTATTSFPHLDILELFHMDNLNHVDDGRSKFSQVKVGSWYLCQCSKEIRIEWCDALSCVIPSYAAGHMQKLQVLKIKKCSSMMEVFETKEISTSTNVDAGGDTMVAIQRPKNIIVYKLFNLKILHIGGCERLEYVCTFSTFESLKKLESLAITDCGAMKVIVKEEYEEQTPASSSIYMTFPHLKSIELVRLQNLAGFFLGTDIDFQWPVLEYVMIDDCPQMMAFTSGKLTAPRLEYMHTKLGKHNIEYGLNFHVTPMLPQTPSPSLDGTRLHPNISERRTWSFHNLVHCNVDNNYKQTKIFPSNELQQLQKLETIHVKLCHSLEEVFEVANNGSQTVVIFPKLREVDLNVLENLKFIWKINQQRILEFPNLTRLSIFGCCSLEYVFTRSMVSCLMQLRELNIQSSWNMKVIVKEEEEDCEAKVSEITFPCLKSLKLDDLMSLEGFCLGKEDFTFPSLDTLEITECGGITVFSKGRSFTPKLTVVITTTGSFNVGEDINSFITAKKDEECFGERYF